MKPVFQYSNQSLHFDTSLYGNVEVEPFVRMSGTEKKLRAQYASIIKSFYRSLDKSSKKLDKMSKQVDDLRQLLKEIVFLSDENNRKLDILISKVTIMQQTIIIFGVTLILVQPKVLYWLSILLSFLKIN